MLYRLSYVGALQFNQSTSTGLSTISSSAYHFRHPHARCAMERVMGIEPTPSAWKAEVLPLNYTRLSGGGGRIRTYEGISQQIYSLPPLAAWVSLRGHKSRIFS